MPGKTAKVTAVIFDWAGTTVDHGSVAPVRALRKLFESRGLEVSEDEIRREMGLLKKDHIRTLLRSVTGQPPAETEVEEYFAEFIPLQMECLAAHSGVIPGVPETVEQLRARNIRIGSTTGYPRSLLDVLLAGAAAQGYAPDCALCPDDAGAGRPLPWMCYLNAIQLRTYPMHTMIKVGDTVSDIEEGRNAGMWTVGVARTGNMIGMTEEDFAALPLATQATSLSAARSKLADSGAHFVVDSAADLFPLVDRVEEALARGERP
jgi:phosphonoacetaldehyde hydrolase